MKLEAGIATTGKPCSMNASHTYIFNFLTAFWVSQNPILFWGYSDLSNTSPILYFLAGGCPNDPAPWTTINSFAELSKEDLISKAILLRLSELTSLLEESLLVKLLPPIFKIIMKSLINPWRDTSSSKSNF